MAEHVARAGRLPEPALHLRVDDEWSFVETLRHLVFATDAWAGRTILDEPKAFLTWGSYPDAGADADDAVPADVADVGVLGDVGAEVVGVGVGALDVGEAEIRDGEADKRWLGDADADWEARVDGEAGALAGCDVPWNDDAAALAGEDASGRQPRGQARRTRSQTRRGRHVRPPWRPLRTLASGASFPPHVTEVRSLATPPWPN